MTYEPRPMTMPSVDCPKFPPHANSVVVERIRQRFNNYEEHGQRCAERYKSAQQTIRMNDKRDTAMLWQRVIEQKNKKGAKCKMDSRQKVTSIDPSEGDTSYQGLGGMQRMGQSLKRKMPMGPDGCDGPGFGDPHARSQQEAKKMKNDQQPKVNGQRQQEYPLPSVSVQIVQNFGTEVPTNQIETTVNVQHTNRNMPDSQSVSVNVGSKNIKQETMNDGRRGPQPPQMANQHNMCPPSVGNPDSNDLNGILGEDFMNMNPSDDIDISMLNDIIEQMPDVINELNRELMTPDGQQQITSQPQQMTSQPQQMSQTHRMTSQSQMMSQSQRMTSQPQDNMMSQSQRLTPQHSQQMTPPQHRMTPQSLMTSQNQQLMTSQPQQQRHMPPSQSHQQHPMTSPFSQSPQHGSLQQQQMTSPLHHHHMGSPPGQHMTSPMMQQPQQNSRVVCKREKVDMYHHGFRGNTPENKQEPQGLPRQNSHTMTQQNISANIMTQQSVRVGGNNFSANISSQQNISLNMMQQNNFPRQMPSNNANMTSQHIHRLNQVVQFPHEPSPPEPQRLYHTQANSHAPSQSSYYESHSQQLKQLAEKTRYGMNGSGSMSMNPNPRSSQPFPPHYRGNGPPMSQQVNVPNHHHHHVPPSNDRLPHVDASMYSRSSQYVQSQRPGMSMMMQQSQEAMMMKQYQMQQSQQHGYYSRVPEPHPQQVIPANPNAFPGNGGPHPSWNSRGPWPADRGPANSHNPMHHPHHRPQVTPEQMHRPLVTPDQMQRPHMNSAMTPSNYLPELDSDLNIIEEILSNRNP